MNNDNQERLKNLSKYADGLFQKKQSDEPKIRISRKQRRDYAQHIKREQKRLKKMVNRIKMDEQKAAEAKKIREKTQYEKE